MSRRNTLELMAACPAAALVMLTMPSATGGNLNGQGFLEVNGSAFIPFGVYDINSQADAMATKSAGLNVAESMLDGIFEWSSEAGLRCLYWMIARTKTDEEILRIVEADRDDPLNLAWYTFDEPNEVGVPASRCEQVYRLLKSNDPERPVVLTLSPAYWYHPWAYSEYASSCDIIATDPYPVEIGHGISLDYVTECIERARKDSGKPVWAVLQAFPWPGKRLPTAQELRCMTYQALVHGATGVLYYTFQVAAWNYSLVATPLWGEIGQMAREIEQLVPVLTTPGPEPVKISSIHVLERHLNNTAYLMAVNVAPDQAVLELPMSVSAEVDVMFENRTLKVIDGLLRDEFGPYAVRSYRIPELLGLSAAWIVGACTSGRLPPRNWAAPLRFSSPKQRNAGKDYQKMRPS